ncbi:hypothetical protein D3P08_09975 [Paenibacillus nanensis]|uniref:Sporulation protein n=1 Tax=Paenibacillus nanensis TaxID=393251 RepID=A0A3A1UXI0_9BACL|nr:YhcN/YlaJ family sporulation lipoprotein [Paenibacillus nanensis]RIX52974.1 hypothetical protein D3P08_09975 [Paenibacillus nanensis]
MKTRVSLTLSALLLCGGLSLASGCGNGNADNQNNGMEARGVRPNALTPSNHTPPGGYKATPDDRNQMPGTVQNGTNQGARVNEAQLAHIAEQVPGVERADVAMNGTDVLVGIELDNSGSRGIVEKRVTSALYWQYGEYRYHVTTDEDLRSKIKSISGRKNGGYNALMFDRDIQSLASQIDQLTTRR